MGRAALPRLREQPVHDLREPLDLRDGDNASSLIVSGSSATRISSSRIDSAVNGVRS